MTDNDVIKAMECCIENDLDDCAECLYLYKECDGNCIDRLLRDALDLINRLKDENSNLTSDLTSLQRDLTSAKAENERLQKESDRRHYTLQCYALQYGTVKDQTEVINKAKAEAVREFADKLKCYAKSGKGYLGRAYYSVAVADIDNLLEEMEKENHEAT